MKNKIDYSENSGILKVKEALFLSNLSRGDQYEDKKNVVDLYIAAPCLPERLRPKNIYV